MAILLLSIPYPDFKLQEVIDPDQFDLNNSYVVDKVNELVNSVNTHDDTLTNIGTNKADVTYVDTKFIDALGVGRTVETIKGNADALATHKISSDHDGRYYTKDYLNAVKWGSINIADYSITASKVDPSIMATVSLGAFVALTNDNLYRLEIISLLGV